MLSALLVVAGCAYNPPPIPVIAAAPAAAVWLEGQWLGEYEAVPGERSGTIAFTLRAGRDTAFGDVLMVPRTNPGRSVAGPPGDTRATPPVRAAQALSVSFVRVKDGSVSGELDPYIDPDIGCLVQTVFVGTLQPGNTLAGTFVTRDESGYIVQRGTWRVSRSVR
jgi:hypothetical protein